MLSMRVLAALVACLSLEMVSGDEPAPSAKEALQPFNEFIGSWRGTGLPGTSREEQQKGFWSETLNWEWQFKGQDAWLKLDIDKGKHFRSGILRWLPQTREFELTLLTSSKESLTFVGPLEKNVLTLQRSGDNETQRLVFTLLHSNRFLYRYEIRPEGKSLFAKKYQVGATKEGVPFAAGDGKPECIVSGGLGTTQVFHEGKTYYVCCGGCRDEFRENPVKYIKEFEAKKAKKPSR